MDVRRVVTGHDASGKSVFVSDEAVAPRKPVLLPGSEFTMLWGGDEAPRFPDDGSMPKWHTYFPPIDGERKLPGLLGYMELDDPGMHTTDTIDFEVVLESTVISSSTTAPR